VVLSASASAAANQGAIYMSWSPPLPTLTQAVVRRSQRLMAALWQLAQRFATRITTWMQINAPWNDSSGQARALLKAVAVQMTLAVVINVAHGVPYGVYLETMQAGRFAILMPAVQEWLPQFFEAAQQLVKTIR